MGDILREAEVVLVWLGEATTKIDLAVDLLVCDSFGTERHAPEHLEMMRFRYRNEEAKPSRDREGA